MPAVRSRWRILSDNSPAVVAQLGTATRAESKIRSQKSDIRSDKPEVVSHSAHPGASGFSRDSSTFLPLSCISQELWNAGIKFKVFLLSLEITCHFSVASSDSGRADQRNHLAFVPAVNAKILVGCDHAVVRIKLAHPDQTKIRQIGLPVGIALG